MKKQNLVIGLNIDEPSQCKACVQEKDGADEIGDLTASDVWGPAQTEGLSHEKYFYSFTDVKSKVIYFGNTKDEVLRHFQMYKVLIETQMGRKLKCFHLDNGGEYIIVFFI